MWRLILLLFAAAIPVSCVVLTDFDGLTPGGSAATGDAGDTADADAATDVRDAASDRAETDVSDADAPGEEPGVPVLVATCEGKAWALAAEGDEVFWTSHQYPNANPSGSALFKASVGCRSGGCGTELAVFPAHAELSDIAVDASWVYLAEKGQTGRVLRVPRSGGEPEVIAVGQPHAYGLAVDPAYVYWTGGDAPAAGHLRRSLKSPAQTDGGASQPQTLLSGLDQPGLLMADPFSEWLYWGSNTELSIRKCYPMSVDGGQGTCQAVEVVASQPGLQLDAGDQAEVFKLAADGTHVYWRQGLYSKGAWVLGSVRRVAKAGTTDPEVVADGDPCLKPRWISLRGDYVYWTGNDGKAYRASKSGGPAEPINDLDPIPGLHSVVALDDAVYASSWTSCALYRIALPTG